MRHHGDGRTAIKTTGALAGDGAAALEMTGG